MYFPARKIRIYRRRIARPLRRIIVLMVLATSAIVLILEVSSWCGYEIVVQSPIKFEEIQQELLSPLPKEAGESGKLQIATASATPEVATRGAELNHIPEVTKMVQGEASYYSRSGCLGCSENLTMANGETLDDSKLTLALTPELVRKHKLLNDTVVVENVKTGKTVKARVTDTGGFGKYNRVADLSVATRDAIQCASLCEVKITY